MGIGTDLQMPPAAAGKPYEINSYENKPRFVSTDHDKRGPRTRMGAVGRHPFFGRRLHRPSGIRRGGDRPPSGSRRVSCSDRAAAQLAGRSARLHQTRRTAALLRRLGRVDGFDGQPLHGQPAPSEQRRLYARRQGGVPARLRRQGLHADSKTAVSARSGGHRRHRSLPAAADPLRLLERHAQTLGAGRKRRRPADLRHGRTGRAAGRPGTAQRIQCQVAAQTAAGGVHGRQRLRGAARPGGDDPAALLRGVCARQSGFRGEFHGHRDTEQPDGTDSDAGRGRGRPLRGRHAAQHNAHDRRTRPLVRPALRTGTAPALQRQGGYPGLGDDQALGQHPQGMLRRLRVLHYIGSPGQIHQLAQRALDPRRGAADRLDARLQGLPLGRRCAVGQHVPHGRARQGTVPQMPPSVVPAPEDVPKPGQRPPAAVGFVRKDPSREGHQEGLCRQWHPLRPVRRQPLS